MAERLNVLRVTVPPFSDIDERSLADCRTLALGAAVVVVCDAPFGRGNLANLVLALEAARAGVATVVLEQVPIGDRDFTGGRASALWQELRGLSVVVRTAEEAMEAIVARRSPVAGA